MNRLFDRSSISVKPLAERKNKLDIERDMIDPESYSVSYTHLTLPTNREV